MLQIPDETFKNLLIQEGLINAEKFDELAKETKRLGQNMADVLISQSIITKDYWTNLVSGYFKVPLAGLNAKPINENILRLLSEDVSRQRRVILFGQEPDGMVSAAMEDPSNLETIEFVERYIKAKIRPYLAVDADLNKGFTLYSQRQSEDFKKLIESNIAESLRLGKRGEESAADVPIVAIVDNIVAYAYSLRASDIHFEIFEDGILVRYRIDGVLREVLRVPKDVHPAIIARIKLLAALKIDEHYKPQDGRFRHKIGPDILDIRVSIIPTYYGEKIEMRLLPSTQRPLSLQELGMFDDMADLVADNIKKSYGMLLVCGPTGSGKTTTLYSILGMLNRPEVNIVTIEDPIEYDIKYINQTQINPQAGITFATGLRSILRQDPNVIMVGEIRDEETASISVQSALTGHLVLSSLHTNDAPTVIPRLIDMKVPAFLTAAVLNAIVAQRLVRKICTNCIYTLTPSPELVESLRRQMKELGLEELLVLPKVIYAGRGCPVCGGSGYRGRMAIFEVLNITEELRKIVVDPSFSLDTLKNEAKKEGMISMFEDGLRKAERGLTTIDELLRVIRE
jgi:type IV pilus assembly protein PilB